MVIFGVRMINAVRILLCGYVIAQNKVKLEVFAALARNRRYCVVGNTVGGCKNECVLVGVISPSRKYLSAEAAYSLGVLTRQTNYRYRPFTMPAETSSYPAKESSVSIGAFAMAKV